MQWFPWWNMKPTYLERFIWCLELDVTLAGWVPAADGQVVGQILIPRGFPINCCHFGLKKKKKNYICMLCIESSFCSFLISTLFSHFYTFHLSSLDILTPQILDPCYHVKVCLEKHLFLVIINISSLSSKKQASVCCVETQKLKLKKALISCL